MTQSPTKTVGALALAFAFAVGALAIGPASPATAHNYPVASNPSEDATVTEQPGTISLTTNDALIDLGNGAVMTVSGPASDPLFYGDGCARVVDRSIEMDAQLGAPGEYTVEWQAVSADGHPISGEFAFDWQPADGVALAEGISAEPVCAGSGGTPSEQDGAGGDARSDDAADEMTADQGNDGSVSSDVIWIAVGIVLAVAAAGIAWWAVTRRRGKKSSGG